MSDLQNNPSTWVVCATSLARFCGWAAGLALLLSCGGDGSSEDGEAEDPPEGASSSGASTDEPTASTDEPSASTDEEVYPTRACVLASTCGTCYNDAECWEGFRMDCPSFVEGASYSTSICPELGFPVNCGQNQFFPAGTTCSPSSVDPPSAGGQKAEGDACSTTSECPSGTTCEPYLGNPSNEDRCMRGCAAHDDCVGASSPNFAMPLSACDFCADGFGSMQCVPLTVCGYSGGFSDACNDCLASCRGLSSCCTGVGCICESDCD